MIENTTSQARAEWPSAPHRIRKRRDSRVAYHHTAKYFHRNVPVPSTSVSPPTNSTSRPSVQIHQPSFPGQASHLDQLNSWDFQASPLEINRSFDQTTHQDGQADVFWPSMISYNYPSIPPNSPHSPSNNDGSPLVGQAQLSSYDLAISFDKHIPTGGNFNSDMDVGSMSDSNYESFGSFDSMNVSDPSTGASSISESYIHLPGTSGLDSPGVKNQMQGLSLEEGFYQAMQNIDPSSSSPRNSISPTSPLYPDPFTFENDFSSAIAEWNIVADVPMYGNETVHWPTDTMVQPQQIQEFRFEQTPTSSQMPWNQHITSFDNSVDAGIVAFEPPPGPGLPTYIAGQKYIDTRQRDTTPQAPVSPTGDDSDVEGWQKLEAPSYPSSLVPSHPSPHSEGSSPFSLIDTPHQTPSPRAHHNDHQHVFTAYPGITKSAQKLPRGRQRALTTKEKKEAREVREAKACWACHLSKIKKCSPCSPGSPCKKCAELMGKRRFCLLPCFNDPLESLYTFMVPDYLMGHFTKANVEKFVSDNATGWGSQEMRIRMMWGYWKPLEAVVVSLEIHKNSQIGFQHQTCANGTSRPILVRKTSPPLGIPLAAMDDMQDEYRLLVHNIVHDDLINYLSIAYDDQESDLPERLLTTIGNFYCASKASGNECELLRQALEIHVTSTILERSLILDEESKYMVENYLGQSFPPRSAARCVQRQVKLAFFEVQRKRIVKVLEAWGSMMWTSNKNTSSHKKWAMSFSVFLSLILVIDKTLGQGYYFCENRIENHGFESGIERRKFQELVRLTQAELFERCKEIFHSSFKTRKNGKEACNPIRDGMGAFKNGDVDKPIERFVDELRSIAREFGREIKMHRPSLPEPGEDEEPYQNAGRLSCIFLDDFLDH